MALEWGQWNVKSVNWWEGFASGGVFRNDGGRVPIENRKGRAMDIEMLGALLDQQTRLGYANGSVQSHFVDELSIDMLHRDRNEAAK